jgi:hypothetical protein
VWHVESWCFSSKLFFKLLGARATGLRTDMRVLTAPAIETKINFQIEIVPADGIGAAKWSKRGLRYVAVF